MRKGASRKTRVSTPPATRPAARQSSTLATASSPVATKHDRRALLVREARDNPFAWFTSEEVAVICGFGVDVMTALRAMGAPVVGRKMNPELLQRWIDKNAADIGKIRPEEG